MRCRFWHVNQVGSWGDGLLHDNARLNIINEKYVLLREFARPNEEWAKKADYIEFLYTDEAEHQAEIQRLWVNRRKRLEQGLTR